MKPYFWTPATSWRLSWQTTSTTNPRLPIGAPFASAFRKLVTTSYVFDEVVTFLNSRGLHDKAVEVGNRLIQSPSVNLVHVDDDLFQSAWEYLQTHQDKTYSLTDCISFVLMGRLAITTALAFDQHFTQAGFERLP